MTESEQTAQKYRQLLLAVSIKYGRESKHVTILRYIKEWEIQVREDQKSKTVNKNNRFDWQAYLNKNNKRSRMKLQPSDFTEFPWGSVSRNAQCETTAANIMKVLEKTGNKWRKLAWEEYAIERAKDGVMLSDPTNFDKVIRYCISADTAVLFSSKWAE